MPVKLSKKRALEVPDWRDAEYVVTLKRRLTKWASSASETFEETKGIVIDIQSARVKRGKLTHSDISSRGLEKLVNSIGADKADRSRITALLMKVEDQTQHMKDALSWARRKIKAEHAKQLKDEFGAITNQNDGIEYHFGAAVRAVKVGESVIRMCGLVINDIDQGKYDDNKLMRSSELIFHPARAD